MDKNLTLITSYKDLDMDGYSSAVAYQELLNSKGLNATAGAVGQIGIETKFVLDFLNLQSIQNIISFDNFDSIIIVDADNLESTEINANHEKVIEIIDHHVQCRVHIYPNAKVQRELIGACATLITERFIAEKMAPQKATAVMLYAGIISNTVNLKNKVTSTRDISASEYLKNLAQIPDDFVEKMFENKSDMSGFKLAEALRYDYYEGDFFGHIFAMSQLELVGASELVKNRQDEIKENIEMLSSKDKPKFQFLNIIDILDGYNIIMVFNDKTEALLSEILRIKFTNNISRLNHIIMRKEIIVKIKEHFFHE